jgi:hypothetical protein
MPNYEYEHYVPVLKGKQGEFRALSELETLIKDKITPLIEAPPIPLNYDTGEPSKLVDEHLERFIPNIVKCWGKTRYAFIDLNFIPDTQGSNGRHPLSNIFQQGRTESLSLIPVTGLYRDGDYQSAIKEIVAEDDRGACIRILPSDIENEELDTSLTELMETLDIRRSETDLIIDLKEIQKDQIGLLVRSVRDVIRNLTAPEDWRTLALIATSFPQTMAGFEPNTVSLTNRAEWQLWTTLLHNKTKIPRMPTFGDYTVVHPELLEIDPRIMQLGAKIKYTYDNDWIIVKGTSIKRGGAEQNRDLCRSLTSLSEYKRSEFSWGDKFIQDCADGIIGPGSQTNWVSVGVNHHITFVVKQLSNYVASSTNPFS